MKRKKNRIPKYITTVAPYHDKNKNIVRITQVTENQPRKPGCFSAGMNWQNYQAVLV